MVFMSHRNQFFYADAETPNIWTMKSRTGPCRAKLKVISKVKQMKLLSCYCPLLGYLQCNIVFVSQITTYEKLVQSCRY